MTTETTANGSAAGSTATALVAATPTTGDGGQTISAFSSEANFTAGQRIAKALASSSLVPEAYRGNIPNVLIAMELANRIGASVFAVMQNIDIIHGRPSWRSTFLIATVNACGRFSPLRFRWQGEEGKTSWGCRAVAKDRESGEECLGALITIGLAQAEGWSSKNGSKWKTMPEQMLMYRAAAFWTRVYAPETALGMQTSDEARDVYGDPGDLPIAMAPGNTKALEQELMAPAVVVDATPVPQSSPSVAPADEPKGKQRAKAQASLPTGDLLAVAPKDGIERDPYGQPVPPATREPGEEG
jgi:hypothetical protein